MDTNVSGEAQASPKNDASPPQAMMMRAIGGMTFALIIKCALDLGVFRVLQEGVSTTGEIAKSLNVDRSALQRLLRALVSTGVFVEVEPNRYTLTDLGATLLPGPTPASIEPLVRFLLDESTIVSLMKLSECVRTGRPSLRQDENVGWYAQHPERVLLMDRGMEVYSKISLPNLLAAYPFSQFNVVVDVAGGVGQLLAGILKTQANMKGILLDRSDTIQRAAGYMKTAGLEERCELISGNMFDEIPTGGDLYVLSKTVNNWDDEHAVRILRNVRSAMSTKGKLVKLVIVENLGSNSPSPEEVFRDMICLASTSGKVRTESELRELILQADLKLTRIVHTSSPFSIIECQLPTASVEELAVFEPSDL